MNSEVFIELKTLKGVDITVDVLYPYAPEDLKGLELKTITADECLDLLRKQDEII